MKQHKADRRSQRTYQLVSSALTELMSEKPYDEIVVQDILDRAGIGRTTFYTHYFDKEDLLESMTEQVLAMFTQQLAHSATGPGQRIIPSLELFEHIYQSKNQHLRVLMRGRAGEPLWEAMQTTLSRAIEVTLVSLNTQRDSPPIPVPVVAEYVAGAFLTLLKWWLVNDMPYPPDQMEIIFRQLALPGVWSYLKTEPKI